LEDLIARFPGEVLVRKGLTDFRARRYTIPTCLVQRAQPRLDAAVLLNGANLVSEPESRMYDLLLELGGNAYSRYNALQRELVSRHSTAVDIALAF
jgi:hypothetical protein